MKALRNWLGNWRAAWPVDWLADWLADWLTQRVARFNAHSPQGKRRLAAVFMLAIAGLTSASIFATGPAPLSEPHLEKSWPVSVETIAPGSLTPSFTAYGRVESSNVALIRTDLVATVASVAVREGDWVAAGQVLLTLDAAEVRLKLAERQAELAQHRATLRSIQTDIAQLQQSTTHYRSMQQVAQNKLARHQELMADRLISRALLDEVIGQASQADIQLQQHQRELADAPNRLAAQQAANARAQALLSQAEITVAKTHVVAPFSGPVLAVHVAPGDQSGSGMPLVELADAGNFEVRVQIPDAYADRLTSGLAEDATITATSAQGLTLALSRVASQIRGGQTGVDAFFRLPAAGSPPLGRIVDLVIALPPQDQVVALPLQAIFENDRVFQVLDKRLHGIEVERVGEFKTAAGEHRVLVRSPTLRAGQRIVTTQLPRAIDGLLVEPA